MTNTNITVSIVTPSYNQGEYLEETILSVLNQDYPFIEYFVFDGGSTDNSVEIIKKYESRISYWVSEKDKGQSDAINKGWRKSSGQLLYYLNSDDKLHDSGVVSKIVELFREKPVNAIFYGDCVMINETGSQIYYQKALPSNLKELLFAKEFGKIMCQPSSFYNAKYVRDSNFLNVDLHFSMDYELAVRLATYGELSYINYPIACFRIHKEQKSVTGVTKQNFESFKIKYTYNKIAGILHLFRSLKFEIFKRLPKFIQKIIKPELYLRYNG